MLKTILLVLVLLIAGFAAYVAMQPGEYAVTRSAVIPGSPATVFGVVNDFHQWDKWSPWAKLDPNMKTTYSGPDMGEGAMYAWEGNDDVGKGKMTITESEPYSHIGIRLEFIEPFASTSQTDFHFKPAANGTEVVWSMSGTNGFMEKAFTMFMDMDAMIGADFEKGLNQMSETVKAMPSEVPEPEPAAEAAASTP